MLSSAAMTTRPAWSLSLVIAVGTLASAACPARAASASGTTPELYHQVVGVHWVVRDVDATRAAWARLGFPTADLGQVEVTGSYRGRPAAARLRAARGTIAGIDVVWLQPVDGTDAFSEFLARHGEGIFSINYAAPSPAALEAEVDRLSALGVGVLRRGPLPTADGTLAVVHMDTAPGGKYVLGLVQRGPAVSPASAGAASSGAAAGGPPFAAKLSQYALVVEDMQAVSDYWSRLGFPVMEVTHPVLGDLRYRGAPGRFDQKLGWHRHGTVTWEWIQPLAGPTVYQEFLQAHGEGVHHLALDVPDIDAAAKALEALGVPIVQSGAWGEKGKPGSGRFAYADTTPNGGVTIELLWSKP